LAYIFCSIDVIVTAYGTLNRWGVEASPFVTAVVPNSQPILQIIYITATVIISFWVVYFAEKWFAYYNTRTPSPVLPKSGYYFFVGWMSIFACITHTYGISTWILIKP
jgi:hypothetical protein